MTIKHIVIPGGGPNFPVLYGVLKKLSMEKFWNFNDLESIHGTSCGSIIGCFLLLNCDWEDIDNYLIGRAPYPGGVGPVTVSGLYSNLAKLIS